MRNAASAGVARTADLRRVVNLVGEWALAGVELRFGWVKPHVGVQGNEHADALAKAGCEKDGPAWATEGGVRTLWKRLRSSERSVAGLWAGRVSGWGRRAVSRYAQLRTGTEAWTYKIAKTLKTSERQTRKHPLNRSSRQQLINLIKLVIVLQLSTC